MTPLCFHPVIYTQSCLELHVIKGGMVQLENMLISCMVGSCAHVSVSLNYKTGDTHIHRFGSYFNLKRTLLLLGLRHCNLVQSISHSA